MEKRQRLVMLLRFKRCKGLNHEPLYLSKDVELRDLICKAKTTSFEKDLHLDSLDAWRVVVPYSMEFVRPPRSSFSRSLLDDG